MRHESKSPITTHGVVLPPSSPSSPTVPVTTRDPVTTANEPPSKRMKVEENATSTAPSQANSSLPASYSADASSIPSAHRQSMATQSRKKQQQSGSSVVSNSPVVSNSSDDSSSESLHRTAFSMPDAPRVPAGPPVNHSRSDPSPSSVPGPKIAPLKATKMDHLRTKYLGELQYMLVEFKKLERQLLGAKGAAQIEESAGSRERREKLHSFIIHLEDTIVKVEVGCRLEDEGKNPAGVIKLQGGSAKGISEDTKRKLAKTSALSNVTKEKEAEENVQKLEEHILANLLPVKVRLTKQLAAQQGATRNPAGMPASRRGSWQASAAPRGKGTFAAAAEERRKQAEAARLTAQQQHELNLRQSSNPTQFGRPLGGGGSSLTRNLHGTTLGSKQRTRGHGVGTPAGKIETESPSNKQILYGGMVPESTQHQSGVIAATGVHDMVIENPSLISKAPTQSEPISVPPISDEIQATIVARKEPVPTKPLVEAKAQSPTTAPRIAKIITAPYQSPTNDIDIVDRARVSEEERRRQRKKRRKRKLLRIAKRRERDRQRQLAINHQAQTTHLTMKVPGGRKKVVLGKGPGRKKGPRAVEYICAQCNEAYNSTCDYNPWWALAQHECPKCRKVQVPRIDITSPSNQIEYHPALLAHAEENGGSVGAPQNVGVLHMPKPPVPMPPVHLPKPHTSVLEKLAVGACGSDSDSDLSELSDGSLSDCSLDSNDSALDLRALTPAEQAEHESFGKEYKGPVLSDNHASRLLVLMGHASTCPCNHKSKRHRDICRSTKYMMLHVRDCPGTTASFDVCPFPWCRQVKHLLYHLVSCSNPSQCTICSPKDHSKSLQALKGLNSFRAQKYRGRLITTMKRVTANGRPVCIPIKKPSSSAVHQRTKSSTLQSATPKQTPISYLKTQSKIPPPSATIQIQNNTYPPPTSRAPPVRIKQAVPSGTGLHPWQVKTTDQALLSTMSRHEPTAYKTVQVPTSAKHISDNTASAVAQPPALSPVISSKVLPSVVSKPPYKTAAPQVSVKPHSTQRASRISAAQQQLMGKPPTGQPGAIPAPPTIVGRHPEAPTPFTTYHSAFASQAKPVQNPLAASAPVVPVIHSNQIATTATPQTVRVAQQSGVPLSMTSVPNPVATITSTATEAPVIALTVPSSVPQAVVNNSVSPTPAVPQVTAAKPAQIVQQISSAPIFVAQAVVSTPAPVQHASPLPPPAVAQTTKTIVAEHHQYPVAVAPVHTPTVQSSAVPPKVAAPASQATSTPTPSVVQTPPLEPVEKSAVSVSVGDTSAPSSVVQQTVPVGAPLSAPVGHVGAPTSIEVVVTAALTPATMVDTQHAPVMKGQASTHAVPAVHTIQPPATVQQQQIVTVAVQASTPSGSQVVPGAPKPLTASNPSSTGSAVAIHSTTQPTMAPAASTDTATPTIDQIPLAVAPPAYSV